jgi:hypothetical protein
MGSSRFGEVPGSALLVAPQGITYVETKGDMSDIHRFPQTFPHMTKKPYYANLLHSLRDQQVVELRIVLPL